MSSIKAVHSREAAPPPDVGSGQPVAGDQDYTLPQGPR
jgi:hypothetical protein